ncbi:MAG: hypothetical protein L0Z62_43315 [Gemmataceae bacterium]|nr:hypothetical protein [Gemmataceae bacterium]
MNVQYAPPVIALGDTRMAQVTVEDLAQLVRHVEQRRVGRQPGRNRGARLAGFVLQPAQLVGKPGAQVRGKVISQWNIVSLPVLLIGGVEGQVGHGVIKAQVRHGEGSQLALAQPRQDQRLVDERPFPPEPFQTFAHLGPHVGVALALPRPLAHGQGLKQRSLFGDGEQLEQLGLYHRPALPARVGLLVSLRDAVEGIGEQPARLDGPIDEGKGGGQVAIAGAGAHAFPSPQGKPALEGVPLQVGQRSPAAIRRQASQLPAAFLTVFGTSAGGFEGADIGFEVLGKRGALVPCGAILAGRHHTGPHQLGAAFQVGQHTAGGLLVTAAGRHSLHIARTVPVLGDEVG